MTSRNAILAAALAVFLCQDASAQTVSVPTSDAVADIAADVAKNKADIAAQADSIDSIEQQIKTLERMIRDRTGGEPTSGRAPAVVEPPQTIKAECSIGGEKLLFTPDVEVPSPVAGSTVKVSSTNAPINVRFYQTPATGHVSVAFERNPSDLWGKRSSAIDYTCAITIGGQTLARSIKDHNEFQRWRVQNKPAPIVVDTASAVQQWKLMPHAVPDHRPLWVQVSSGLRYPSPWLDAVESGEPHQYLGRNKYEPLGSAGLQTYMGAPGGRNDWGPVTEANAALIACQRGQFTDAALCKVYGDVAREQAEAVGSMPINLRDPSNGQPLKWDGEYKRAWWQRAWTSQKNTFIPVNKSGWTMDTAHFPGVAYVLAVLTQDPYLVESVQFSASYVIGNQNPVWRGEEKGLILATGEPRARAWSLIRILQAINVSQDGPFKGYLQGIVSHNRDYIVSRETPGDYYSDLGVIYIKPIQYKGGPEWTALAPTWMEEWITIAMSWAHILGEGDWSDQLRHRVDAQYRPRLEAYNKPGFNLHEAGAYQYVFSKGAAKSDGTTIVKTWREAKELTASPDVLPENERITLGQEAGSFGLYTSYLRAALQWLAWAGQDVDDLSAYVEEERGRLSRLEESKLYFVR